jgi:hemoglobin-like flavoprotein
MSGNAVTLAKASYQRCLNAQDFFPTFYQRFFETCPAARPMFARTDFDRQHRLLQHAIALLLSFNVQKESEPNLLTRVAERHGRNDLKVDPAHYSAFLASLIDTVRVFDSEFTPETEQAWHEATAAGIAYMRTKA